MVDANKYKANSRQVPGYIHYEAIEMRPLLSSKLDGAQMLANR